MRSLRSLVRSALVGCPKIRLNTSSCYANRDWTSSDFVAGREGVISAANRMRSHKDGVYHKTMGFNLSAIMKSNSCW